MSTLSREAPIRSARGGQRSHGARLPVPEGEFSKARLEAFSDGVLAVVITIMVLDLKAPLSADPGALGRLWPAFAIYLVSFLLTALYWVNHHSLLAQARRVTVGLLWANNGLLLSTSLIPFATALAALSLAYVAPRFIDAPMAEPTSGEDLQAGAR
jgi:uncharacterized membrane protein